MSSIRPLVEFTTEVYEKDSLMEMTLNGYYTLILATFVLLLGRFLIKKIKVLEDFNIPEPVVGGLVAAMIGFINGKHVLTEKEAITLWFL